MGVKHLAGRLILNLGCGTKASAHPGVVNIDWSVMLRVRSNPLLNAAAPLLVGRERLERLRALPGNIMVHNLRKGIPFAADCADAVYHSHVLEHLDRPAAADFVREARRVLKPGGIHRIVVPDLEAICRRYVSHLAACEGDPLETRAHDGYVAELLEQSVRREAAGTRAQTPVRRRVENWILGDARKRSETHQWMYDRVNLAELLSAAGFRDVRLQTHLSSRIPDWNAIGLDLDGAGNEHKPGSLYVEAVK